MQESPIRILVVDDLILMRFIVKAQIEQCDLELRAIDEAFDGREAVALARQHHYNLIFMDVQMPRMTGLEAAVAIREHELKTNVERTIIVALTGTPDRDRCLKAGMDDFLLKPVTLDELRACLSKWLQLGAKVA